MRRELKSFICVSMMSMLFLSVAAFLAPSTWAANATLSVELNENTSCPFVFTWDGTDFQLENDIYSVGRSFSGPGDEPC